MARRLSERGAYCRTAYFDDEGHGFTRQASISKALGVELDFLSNVLRLPCGPPDSDDDDPPG